MWAQGSNVLLIHLLISVLFTLFVCLLGFTTYFLFSSLIFLYLSTSILAFFFVSLGLLYIFVVVSPGFDFVFSVLVKRLL